MLTDKQGCGQHLSAHVRELYRGGAAALEADLHVVQSLVPDTEPSSLPPRYPRSHLLPAPASNPSTSPQGPPASSSNSGGSFRNINLDPDAFNDNKQQGPPVEMDAHIQEVNSAQSPQGYEPYRRAQDDMPAPPNLPPSGAPDDAASPPPPHVYTPGAASGSLPSYQAPQHQYIPLPPQDQDQDQPRFLLLCVKGQRGGGHILRQIPVPQSHTDTQLLKDIREHYLEARAQRTLDWKISHSNIILHLPAHLSAHVTTLLSHLILRLTRTSSLRHLVSSLDQALFTLPRTITPVFLLHSPPPESSYRSPFPPVSESTARAQILKRAVLPPLQLVRERSYAFTPEREQVHEPLPREQFLHDLLYHSGSEYSKAASSNGKERFWVERLPKLLHRRVEWRYGHGRAAWGVEIEEGVNWAAIFLLSAVLAMFFLCALGAWVAWVGGWEIGEERLIEIGRQVKDMLIEGGHTLQEIGSGAVQDLKEGNSLPYSYLDAMAISQWWRTTKPIG